MLRRFIVVVVVVAVVFVGFAGINLAIPSAAAAPVPDADVVALTSGLGQLSQFSKGLAETGSFAQLVSELTVSPGEPAALGFNDLLDKLIVNRVPSSAVHLADLAGLSTGAGGIDLEVGGRHAVLTATPIPAPGGSTTEQLKLDFTVTRTLDSGLQISSTSPNVQLNAGQGVQANFTLTGTMTVAFDSSNSFFYLVRTASTPSVKVDVSASIPDLTKVDTSIGILAMKLSASTFQLEAHYATTWFDSNHDGRLAFAEPASGNTTTPGELAQAANTAAIVGVAYAASPLSTVSGQLDLDITPSSIPGLTLPSIPTSLTVTSSDLSSTPAVVTTSALDARLVKFATIGPKDLATSLAREMFLVRAAQFAHFTGAQQGDVALPLIDGKLSDAIHADEFFVKYLTDPANIDQTTGQPKFASIQEFFDGLKNETVQIPANGPALVTATVTNTAYDDSTSRLAFELVVTRTGGTEKISDPSNNDKLLGTVQVGNATRSISGIRNAASPAGGNLATTAPTYTLRLPVVIDLRPPTTGSACATANDPSDPANSACPFTAQVKNGNQVIGTQVISSLPITPERFLLATGGTLLDADTNVAATIDAPNPSVGMAGFVQAGFDTGTIAMSKANGAPHLVHIALASQGLQRISALVSQIAATPSAAISYDTQAKLDASLHGFVPGSSHFFDGADPTVTATSDDITQASHLSIVGPDLHDRLKPLDFGNDPNVLRGTAANALGALRDTLQKLGTLTTGATQERLTAKVQLLGRSLASLLSTSELDGAVTSISTNAGGPNQGPPESLQDLVTRVSNALGGSSVVSFHMDGAHPAAHLVLDVDYKRILDNDPAQLLGVRFHSSGKALDLVGVGSDGTLTAKGGTDAHVGLALPLDGAAPSDPGQVLVQGDASVSFSPDVAFNGSRTATIGALPVTLGPSANIEVHPRLTLTGANSGFVSLQNWATGAAASAPGGSAVANLPTLGSNFNINVSGDDIFFGDNLTSITPDDSSVTVPANLAGAQSSLTLDLTKIKDGLNGGLGPYLDDVSHALDTASANGKLPFVGSDIQEGSQFVKKLKQDLTDAINALSTNAVNPTSGDVQTALNALSLPEATGFTITATVTCSGLNCLGTEPAAAVDGVKFSMTVGQGSVTPGTPCIGTNCPSIAPGKLDLGIPGVRFRSDSSPTINLGWQLKLTFGFDKDHGFFLDAGSPNNNDLKVALSVNLPNFSGEIGFVTVDATDMNGGNGQGATADASHDKPEFSGVFEIGLQQINGKSLLGIGDIASADIGELVHVGLSANANVQYDLNAGVSSDFPGLDAHLGVVWNWASGSDPSNNTGLSISFSNVQLDLGPLFEKLLGPVYDSIKKTISPLKPVVDAIGGPIPGVSDVSHMVGGGDISVLTLMKLYGQFSGNGDQTTALERVLRLVKSVVDFGATGKVDLGTFGVDPNKALAGVPTPDQIESFLVGKAMQTGQQLIADIGSKCAQCADALNKLETEIGLDGLDPSIGFHFPVLDHPEKLAGLLLGEDIPLVTYDTGPMHNHFDFAISIGPLGLPIFIDIGIAATVDMRFSGGFDTYGIRKAIESGKLASILDGLYLEDFDAQGHERPEISIHDTMVYIDAKLSLAVVEAGIRGQISLTATLDLHDTDSPQKPDQPGTGTGDGKVRLNEIGRDASGNFNAFCIFDVSGKISADLVLFFRINFPIIGTEEWDDTLASATILDFDNNKLCNAPAPPPILAHVAGNDLIVHVGKFGTGALRGDSHWDNGPGGDLTKAPNPPLDGAETQPTEISIVRALHDPSGAFLGFGVDLLGYHQDFLVADHAGLDRVIVDAGGYDGRETVNLLGDGTGTDPNATKTTVAHFDHQAVVIGGKQDDQIKIDGAAPAGSNVAPVVAVDGGRGNDRIATGDGNDLVAGGPGDDQIASGVGADQIAGDAGLAIGPNYAASLDAKNVSEVTGNADPSLNDGKDQIDAGLGADVANGGGGDDTISGGVDDGRAVTDPTNAALRDDNNVLIGGSGNDNLSGGPHHDTMYGDYYDTSLNNGLAFGATVAGLSYNDHIDTGFGDDTVFGGAGADTISGRSVQADATQNPAVVATSDTIYGNGGTDNIASGSGDDTLSGGPDDDVMLGGTGHDTIHGDAGNDTIGGDAVLSAPAAPFGRFSAQSPTAPQDGNDTIYGDAGNDQVYGGGGNDTIYGDQANAVCPTPLSTNPIVWAAPAEPVNASDGNDTINGGSGNDVISGEGGNDTITGAGGADRMCGHAGNDTISSGSGDDLASGGSGNDTVYGDDGNDHLEGNGDSDTISGGPGLDEIIGGTSVAASADSGDTLYGDADTDTIVGDNGTITNAAPPVVNVFDLTSGNSSYGGGDTIDAGSGNDFAFGGLADDTIRGGDGNDHLEGNNGADTIYGDAGEDELVGGGFQQTSPGSGTGMPDGIDTIFGGTENDVIAGDNAIVGSVAPASSTDTVKGRGFVTGHAIQLLDLGYSPASGTSDGDVLHGDDGADVIYGQGGSDIITGDVGDDYAEGGPGADAISGNTGNDDLVGGSSIIDHGSGVTSVGQPDIGDTISGGGDADVVIGDNGKVLRDGTPPSPLTSRPGMNPQRAIVLYDLTGSGSPATAAGADLVTGDDGVDVILGQGGNDRLKGNAGDDYVEGNQGSDAIEGNIGNDDLVGGSSTVQSGAGAATVGQADTSDAVWGGPGDDVITGDNALVVRIGPRTSTTDRLGTDAAGTRMTARNITLYDLNGATPRTTPAASQFGDDQLSGGSGVDVMYGQDGNDQISGGPNDDYVEGNGGNDILRGDVRLDQPSTTAGEASTTLISTVWPGSASAFADLEGAGVDGQDDMMGGSALGGFRDGNDQIEGDGESDFQLGDNGTLKRDVQGVDGSATERVFRQRYPDGAPPANAAVIRIADPAVPNPNGTTRFCTTAQTTCEPTGAFGNDTMFGDGGNDTMWGQDGNDTMHGGAGNDDAYGELGDDVIFGDDGNDAILGDRGGIVDELMNPSDIAKQSTVTLTNTPKETYVVRLQGTLDHRVDLLHDINGDVFVGASNAAAMPHAGLNEGGNDRIHGGKDQDNIHAGFGDDLANGDSGGDVVFGDDGADVIWGGKGCDQAIDTLAVSPDCYAGGAFDPTARGTNDRFVDHMFGGVGGTSDASKKGISGSDIMDWRPRGTYAACTPTPFPATIGDQTVDPCSWFEMTNTDDDTASPATVLNNQHHQGTDWMYGGWDRDVMQGDVAQNGPNPGDRELDWTGAYNLYTHCNSAYGGYNDVRQHSPAMQDFLQQVTFGDGAGQLSTDSATSGTSGFRELALVYPGSDNDHSAGPAYPTTPGHFDTPSCAD